MGLLACQPIMPPTPVAPLAATTPAAEADEPAPLHDPEPTAEPQAELTATQQPAEEAAVSAPEFTAEQVSAGLAVYRSQYCGICHVSDAAETRGTFGPTHNDMAATAAQRITAPEYRGAATTPAAYILESIVDPQAFIVPGYALSSHRMPPYTHLDVADLDALTAFLLAQ